MRIGFIDSVHPILAERLLVAGHAVVDRDTVDNEGVSRLEGLVVRSTMIDRDLLARAPQLRFIARAGAGMENIDREECARRSILLFNSPEGNRDGVGEWCVAQLLMLMKGLARVNTQVHSGTWSREPNRGHDLNGHTVGIIGYGSMGRAFAEKLSGFGVKVLAHDKYISGFETGHVREASLEHVLGHCDVISLHLPLNNETQHFADKAFFDALKRPIWLLNSSRGPIMHTTALLDALDHGQVRGAALDVLEYELPDLSGLDTDRDTATLKRLMNDERVLLSPHIAGVTHEGKFKMANVLADKILERFPNGNT
jgi:D-3-phosphoglycerate dehydrogenase / 2-oxoglutarate reductase